MIRNMTIAAVIALCVAVPATAQEKEMKTAGKIAETPARDVGIAKTKIPPVLQSASANPYAPAKTCTAINSGIRNLTATLGPDYGSGTAAQRNGVAEIGGQALASALIPFRGLVREATGAAAAQRRLEAAISAGYARRGYLRGLQAARGCKR